VTLLDSGSGCEMQTLLRQYEGAVWR
jgi:hypothetical protein